MDYSNGISGFTGATSRCGLGEGGTTAGRIATAAPNGAGTDYAIGGIGYYLADTADLAVTPAVAARDGVAQAPSTVCLYGIQLNAAGAATAVKGREVSTAAYAAGELCELPAFTDGRCPIGIIKITTGPSATFVIGTTDLSAAGITPVYINLVGGVPSGRL